MLRRSSGAPAAKRLRRAQQRRRSTWKSVRSVILSSPANKSLSIRPAAWNDSRENTKGLLEDIELIGKYIKHLLFTAMSWGLSSSDDEILVGGQAVIEGVMMRSPKGYSVAVRRPDGTIRILKDALLSLGEKFKFFKLPLVRGVGVLGQALVLGIRALRFSAEEALRAEDLKKQVEVKDAQKDPAQVSSWLIAGNLVLALGINLLLFVALPLFITRVLQTKIGFQSSILFNGIDGMFRVLVFVGFLYMVSWMKDMNRVFEYHGAEHKTVYNFEAREDLKVANAKKFSTLHPRCGTSFLLVVMIVSILVFSLAHRSEEHTSELQSHHDLVCRLLL